MTKDLVGKNKTYNPHHKHRWKGSLYQDFLVFDDLLIIAHSKIVTIVDLLDTKTIKCQHLKAASS